MCHDPLQALYLKVKETGAVNNLVVCPACEGRGTYCLHLNDGGWSELVILDVPCDLCDGKRVVRDDGVQFDFSEVQPAYPYAEID